MAFIWVESLGRNFDASCPMGIFRTRHTSRRLKSTGQVLKIIRRLDQYKGSSETPSLEVLTALIGESKE